LALLADVALKILSYSMCIPLACCASTSTSLARLCRRYVMAGSAALGVIHILDQSEMTLVKVEYTTHCSISQHRR
jgi:hypothetical protein